ncbi:hypothetical protein CLOP_g25517 [Closterium sp. NIES-67]|nr:hypothetical protein CLOP_g25517 [Closterium sp. NIES-67]
MAAAAAAAAATSSHIAATNIFSPSSCTSPLSKATPSLLSARPPVQSIASPRSLSRTRSGPCAASAGGGGNGGWDIGAGWGKGGGGGGGSGAGGGGSGGGREDGNGNFGPNDDFGGMRGRLAVAVAAAAAAIALSSSDELRARASNPLFASVSASASAASSPTSAKSAEVESAKGTPPVVTFPPSSAGSLRPSNPPAADVNGDDDGFGVTDWLGGALYALLSKHVDRQMKRRAAAERQQVLAEAADMVAAVLEEKKARESEDPVAHRSEVGALRRLQREAFQDLLRLKDSMHTLQLVTGLRHRDPPRGPNARPPLSGSRIGAAGSAAAGSAAAGAGGVSGGAGGAGLGRTRLLGEVSGGAAVVPGADGPRGHSARAALEEAGMRSGLLVKFKFETLCRAADLLVTELTAGLGEDSSSFMLGGPINLHKVVYSAEVADGVRVVAAPVGASGTDIAESMNPHKGQGLTRFASNGIPLHQRAKGTALGISLVGTSASFSAAQFLHGWGVTPDAAEGGDAGAGLCSSSLVQLALQPQDNVLLSFSALRRVWPAPPLPSAPGLHWSELGPMVLPRLLPWFGGRAGDAVGGKDDPTRSAPAGVDEYSGSEGRELWVPPPMDPTVVQSVAVAGAVRLNSRTTIAAWAQAEGGEWVPEEAQKRLQWSLSLLRQGKGEAGEAEKEKGEDESGEQEEEEEAVRRGTAAAGSGGSGAESGDGSNKQTKPQKKKKNGGWRILKTLDKAGYGICLGIMQPDAVTAAAGAGSSGSGSGSGGMGAVAGGGVGMGTGGRGMGCCQGSFRQRRLREWRAGKG